MDDSCFLPVRLKRNLSREQRVTYIYSGDRSGPHACNPSPTQARGPGTQVWKLRVWETQWCITVHCGQLGLLQAVSFFLFSFFFLLVNSVFFPGCQAIVFQSGCGGRSSLPPWDSNRRPWCYEHRAPTTEPTSHPIPACFMFKNLLSPH